MLQGRLAGMRNENENRGEKGMLGVIEIRKFERG